MMTTNNYFITSSNLLTELDVKEHGVINRWRHVAKNREEELKDFKDKFSSAHRSILTQQIDDKIQDANNEQKLSEAYARDSAKHEAIVLLLTNRQELDRCHLARDINDFRTTCQQPNDAREYDLNHTSMSTVEWNNESAHLQHSLGSCLSFQGEDRNKQAREQIQKDQMYRWITEQCRQKDEVIKEQQMSDQTYDNHRLMISNRLKNLETIQMIRRNQLENDIKAFNRALANQKQCQRRIKEACEFEDKQQETENPILSMSRFGARRPLLTHWKGVTHPDF